MNKELDYIENVEKAIQKKYGKNAVKDPRSDWSEDKEEKYLEQKKNKQDDKKSSKREKMEADGFLVSRKLLNRNDARNCPICKKYSFETKDDVYIKKFSCCYRCFILHVEGREEKWEDKKRKLLDDDFGKT
jgi:hypothetical protein